MTGRTKRGALALMLLLSGVVLWSTDNTLYHSLRSTILVRDAEASADAITAWIESTGGYLLYRSEDYLVIRLPHTRVAELSTLLEGQAERVIELSPQAVDLRESILGTESSIRSREEILAKNLEYIDEADVAAALEIEREILRLLREIEDLKGRLRKLTVDRSMARAEVNLRFMEQTLPTDIPSSFGWINAVDFYLFATGR